jgi:hypothetical protein
MRRDEKELEKMEVWNGIALVRSMYRKPEVLLESDNPRVWVCIDCQGSAGALNFKAAERQRRGARRTAKAAPIRKQ